MTLTRSDEYRIINALEDIAKNLENINLNLAAIRQNR